MIFIFIFILGSLSFVQAAIVPLSDNVMFAFEKCKTLSVNLEKGQLKEEVVSSFDMHCKKSEDKQLSFKCSSFDSSTDKKLGESTFTGGSELGAAELKDSEGRKISFLIGKGFAAYDSPIDHKVCIGIYLFEKDALKRKARP